MPHGRRRHAAARVAAEFAGATPGKHDDVPGAIDPLAALTGALDDGSGKRLKLCWFHAHGKCTKGDTCSFAHAASQASDAVEREPPAQRVQPLLEEADHRGAAGTRPQQAVKRQAAVLLRGAAGKRPQQAVVELAGALPDSPGPRQPPGADGCGGGTMAAPGAPDAGVTTAFAHAALQQMQAALALWNIAEMVRLAASAASVSVPAAPAAPEATVTTPSTLRATAAEFHLASFAGADPLVPVGYELAWPVPVDQGYPLQAQAAPQFADAEFVVWPHTDAQCSGGHPGVPGMSGEIAMVSQRPDRKLGDLSPNAASSALSTAGSGASEVDLADSSSDTGSEEAQGLLVVKNTFLTIQLAEDAQRPMRRVGSAPALLGAGARSWEALRTDGPAARSSSFENLRLACGN